MLAHFPLEICSFDTMGGGHPIRSDRTKSDFVWCIPLVFFQLWTSGIEQQNWLVSSSKAVSSSHPQISSSKVALINQPVRQEKKLTFQGGFTTWRPPQLSQSVCSKKIWQIYSKLTEKMLTTKQHCNNFEHRTAVRSLQTKKNLYFTNVKFLDEEKIMHFWYGGKNEIIDFLGKMLIVAGQQWSDWEWGTEWFSKGPARAC